MRPGLSRAVPMGILGFLAGMVLLVIIRGLQSLEPLMDPQLAIILGTFLAAGFFVYGMGAFDPRMNQHVHEPAEGEEEHALAVADEEAEATPPRQLLGGYVWQLSTILIIVLLVIVTFALLPQGPSLKTVHQADADVSAVGYVPIPFGNQTFYVSQLTVLVGFVIFMFLSLGAAAGVISLVMFILNNGVTQVKDQKMTALESEPLEHVDMTGANRTRWLAVAVVAALIFGGIDLLIGRPITNEFGTLSFFLSAGCVFAYSVIILGAIIRFVAAKTNWPWLIRALVVLLAVGLITGPIDFGIVWFLLSGFSVTTAVIFNLAALLVLVAGGMVVDAVFAILSGILVPLFYFLLIGLVVPFAPPLLFGISASNALLIAALILRPKFLMHWLAYGAAWTARQLRRLPNGLQ